MNVNDLARFSQDHSRGTGEQTISLCSDLAENNMVVLGHEIRNPLSALTYALEAWPSSSDDQQLEQCLLQIMRRQVKQLTRLCNDLLDAGKSIKSSISICRATMDIRNAIQYAIEEVRPFAETCGNTLSVELGNCPFTVFGDESRLTQVFANLMHNSSKFTDRGGYIHISVKREGNSVVVQLRDNGRGICIEKIGSIFGRDDRTEINREVEGEGLGIGLRLAKKIIELHNGSIEAASEGLGLGSTFVVSLPICTRTQSGQEEESKFESYHYRDMECPLPRF